MARKLLMLMAAVILSGCAYQIRLNPPSKEEKKDLENLPIQPLKKVPETHISTALFVNRTVGVWQKCLIFQGYYSRDQLLVYGYDGMAKLNVDPIGYFQVGPALEQYGAPAGEKLAGFFLPGNDYTVLVISEGFDGVVLDINTTYLILPRSPLGYKYNYYTYTGQHSWRYVNYVAYLPQIYPNQYGNGNNFTVRLNINDLLRRTIRAATRK